MKTIKDALDDYINSNYTFRCQEKYKGLVGRIRAFLDKLQVELAEENGTKARYRSNTVYYSGPFAEDALKAIGIDREDFYKQNSFAVVLRDLIKLKGKDNISVYKKAQLDRKLFSKIMTNYHYIPSKKTVISLAIALELSISEAQNILNHCGFVLSENILFDVIITFFIKRQIYDLDIINCVLSAYGQKILSQ